MLLPPKTRLTIPVSVPAILLSPPCLLWQDVLRQLSVLAYIARRLGPIREIPIIMYIVSAMFDTLRNIDEYMETSMWKSCRGYINRVRYILFSGDGGGRGVLVVDSS